YSNKPAPPKTGQPGKPTAPPGSKSWRSNPSWPIPWWHFVEISSLFFQRLESLHQKIQQCAYRRQLAPARGINGMDDFRARRPIGQHADQSAVVQFITHEHRRQLHEAGATDSGFPQGGHGLRDITRTVAHVGAHAIRTQ